MAHFMGTVQGSRGLATRLGHQTLTVRAASYSGAPAGARLRTKII